jgi:hypothetical protein
VNITIEQAERLFVEANDWTLGKQPYLSEDSEIRKLAVEIFGKGYISILQAVCNEIFRVLAEHAHNNWH